jgi:hypothetical protein
LIPVKMKMCMVHDRTGHSVDIRLNLIQSEVKRTGLFTGGFQESNFKYSLPVTIPLQINYPLPDFEIFIWKPVICVSGILRVLFRSNEQSVI